MDRNIWNIIDLVYNLSESYMLRMFEIHFKLIKYKFKVVLILNTIFYTLNISMSKINEHKSYKIGE